MAQYVLRACSHGLVVLQEKDPLSNHVTLQHGSNQEHSRSFSAFDLLFSRGSCVIHWLDAIHSYETEEGS